MSPKRPMRPYDPILKMAEDGIPILSRKRIEVIAERFLADFRRSFPGVNGAHFPARFAEQYLGLTVREAWLSHNSCVLGITVFEDGTQVPVYNPETNAAALMRADQGTVFLDLSLQPEAQRYRRAFTLLHECAHHVLHRNYYRRYSAVSADRNPEAQPAPSAPATCPPSQADHGATAGMDWLEWQANSLATSLLMPFSAVKDWCDREDVQGYYDSRVLRGISEHRAYRMMVAGMAIRFSVSEEAADFRLKNLNLQPR